MDSESKAKYIFYTLTPLRRPIEFRKRLKPTRLSKRNCLKRTTSTKYQVTCCFSKCDNNRKVNYKSIIKMAPKDGL